MKEAIANAGVFNLIIIFVIILLAFFVGSLGYSKAYKVKNRIIAEIEKEQEYNETVQDKIEVWLSKVGYRMNTNDDSFTCSNSVDGGILMNNNRDYQYCVYEYNTCGKDKLDDCDKYSKYYKVIAYMYFDIPIIGKLLRLPVSGETISFTVINS